MDAEDNGELNWVAINNNDHDNLNNNFIDDFLQSRSMDSLDYSFLAPPGVDPQLLPPVELTEAFKETRKVPKKAKRNDPNFGTETTIKKSRRTHKEMMEMISKHATVKRVSPEEMSFMQKRHQGKRVDRSRATSRSLGRSQGSNDSLQLSDDSLVSPTPSILATQRFLKRWKGFLDGINRGDLDGLDAWIKGSISPHFILHSHAETGIPMLYRPEALSVWVSTLLGVFPVLKMTTKVTAVYMDDCERVASGDQDDVFSVAIAQSPYIQEQHSAGNVMQIKMECRWVGERIYYVSMYDVIILYTKSMPGLLLPAQSPESLYNFDLSVDELVMGRNCIFSKLPVMPTDQRNGFSDMTVYMSALVCKSSMKILVLASQSIQVSKYPHLDSLSLEPTAQSSDSKPPAQGASL